MEDILKLHDYGLETLGKLKHLALEILKLKPDIKINFETSHTFFL